MRRFRDRTVRLGDFIAEYESVSSDSSDWRDAQIRKIKRLSEGVSLNSTVTVSYIVGRVGNTLYSITELPNQEEEK